MSVLKQQLSYEIKNIVQANTKSDIPYRISFAPWWENLQTNRAFTMQSTRFCFKVICCHISVCNSWWHCLGTGKAKVSGVGQVWRDIKDFYFSFFFSIWNSCAALLKRKVCHLTLETGFSPQFFFFYLLYWKNQNSPPGGDLGSDTLLHLILCHLL